MTTSISTSPHDVGIMELSLAMPGVVQLPGDHIAWAPVAAGKSAWQERLASDLTGVMRVWLKDIRPGWGRSRK